MPAHTISPDTMLSIRVGCVMTRNQFTQNPARRDDRTSRDGR
ncbi:MAG TPA: hypothetical protein VN041_15615 [Microbacterium sp.]|nr:hypothetical protein [Microbacterium sp.]